VAVEMEEGLLLAILPVDERGPKLLRRALAPLLQRLGVGVLVTDDLGSYLLLARQLGLRQQVCSFHLLRWAGRELGEEWAPMLVQVGAFSGRGPRMGGRGSFGCGRGSPGPAPIRIAPLGRLRGLLLRLSEGWEGYRLHRRDLQVPTINNRSEQAIGRFRIRARAMRGIQSWAGLEAAPASPTSRWPGGVQAHTRSRAPAFTSSRPKIANRTCDSNWLAGIWTEIGQWDKTIHLDKNGPRKVSIS
jgi:hypothetical protein